MRTIALTICAFIIAGSCLAQPALTRPIDDFESGDISQWESSMSPEYYRGGMGQKGLEVVADPERGNVLRCNVRYKDARGSEPAFITRKIEPRPNQLDVVGCNFWAKLTAPAIDPTTGFKVRLRTDDTSFTDHDVQGQLGRPFPVDEWVHVELDTQIGPAVRNIWGKVFGTIREMTFRLDDIDDKNSEFALLVDDVELIVKQPAADVTYEPKAHERTEDGETRILLITHRAAGYYDLEEAILNIAPEAKIDTYYYRGLHFELFGFPEKLEDILAYDAIFMVDVDPFIMTWDQCAHIADAVASGTHLVVFGGPVTLTQARDFRVPLRSVLPVTFEPEAKPLTVNARPVAQGDHFLNQGLDPDGLGTVTWVQDLKPIDGAAVPWMAAEKPLVITAPVQKGSSTVVNTWAKVDSSPTGSFFTSTLSDDFMRQLARYSIGWTGGSQITSLELPGLTVIGGQQVTLRARYTGAASPMRLREADLAPREEPLDPGRSVEGRPTDDGSYEFTLNLPPSDDSETRHRFLLFAGTPAQGPTDFRDFELVVRNPIGLDVSWQRNKYTFAPGGLVEFTAQVSRRDLPLIQPGASTVITYADGKFPVSIDNFVDSWVYQPGTETVIHNQVGDDDVKVEAKGGLLPEWSVSGHTRSARSAEDIKFAEDDRILNVLRGIRASRGGQVSIWTEYEFNQDMRVSRLPLTISLPVSVYAGMKYTLEQEEGVTEGVFPVEMTKGNLFDGHGLKLTIHTPEGPVTISRQDPKARVWMRDLRQYDMTSYRLEVESPYENREAKRGEKYRIELRVDGPTPEAPVEMGAIPESTPNIDVKASIVDPRSGYSWQVPCVETGIPARFAGELPDLASGQYELQLLASVEGKPIVSTGSPCYVVDPLDMSDFFPIMSIVGFDGDGHWLDDEGVKARVDDLIDHGFNTAAITGTSQFTRGNPSNAHRLNSVAESYAQQRGMATTYEYSSFTDLHRDGAPGVCVFDPAYPEELKKRLDWQIDIGNRTPRLMTAKVLDEPTVAPVVLGNISDAGKAEFKQRYGIEYAEKLDESEDPYTRWAMADFMGAYVAEGYRHSGAIMQELGASFDLLLTYMATGLGYQRPLSGQQDALDWTREVKWADFDVYPYFYPASQRIRMVQAGFAMTYMRDVSRATGVPWGFYMELDDRNWPFQKNPKEATAECGYTAVAHGVDYLNSFINRVASTGTGSRPERWEEAGKALRAIRELGPMLKHMPPVRATAAILFPNAQQAIGNGYPAPQYALQAIRGSYGECDVYNEEVAVEKGELPYKALFLFKAEFIHEDLVPMLKGWLDEGGVLVCDKLPAKTHRGADIDWGFGAEPKAQPDAGSLKFSVEAVGAGKVVFIENDIDQEFGGLAEAIKLDPAACTAYRDAIRGLMDNLGLTPNVRVSYSESAESVDVIEAGLRGNDDALLLTVVNHQPEAQRVVVQLLAGDRCVLVDTGTGEPVSFTMTGLGEPHFLLDVPGRGARMIACYSAQPDRLVAKIDTPTVTAGEMLEYRVSAVDADGIPVKGGSLLELEVAQPDGEKVTRFGGAFAPVDGVQKVSVAVPVNAPKGQYRVTVTAPHARLETAAGFVVR